MAQYHHQWTRRQHNNRLGVPMETQLVIKNTGDWIGTDWQLVSTVTIDGREYEHRERVPTEPGELAYRQHRSRASRHIVEQMGAR